VGGPILLSYLTFAQLVVKTKFNPVTH